MGGEELGSTPNTFEERQQLEAVGANAKGMAASAAFVTKDE